MTDANQEVPVLRQRLSTDAENTRASMQQFPAEIALLETLHRLFDAVGGLIATVGRPEQEVALSLYQVAGDALVSASLHALKYKGQESFLFLRKAVEATAFAARIATSETAAQIWIDRKKRLKEFRQHFKSSEIFKAGGLVCELRSYYDLSSDAGVHANLESLVFRRSRVETEAGLSLRYAVYDIEPVWINRSLIYAARAIRDVYAAFVKILTGNFKDEREPARVLAIMDAELAPVVEAYRQRWGEESSSSSTSGAA